jgi:hypothetical protein
MENLYGPFTGPPKPWERSRYYPQFVFVAYDDLPLPRSCSNCVFSATQQTPGCSDHPCSDGLWVTVEDAVILRLES